MNGLLQTGGGRKLISKHRSTRTIPPAVRETRGRSPGFYLGAGNQEPEVGRQRVGRGGGGGQGAAGL